MGYPSYDLTFNHYADEALKTAVYPGQGEVMGLAYVALGLGEAGEFQGKVKKVLRDDDGVVTPERREALIDELGDVLWYVAGVARELGVPLEDVAARNLMKLSDRADRGAIRGDGDKR